MSGFPEVHSVSTGSSLGSLQTEDADSKLCHDYSKRDHRNVVERALEPEPANGYYLLIVCEVPGTYLMCDCGKRSDKPPRSPF